MTVPLASELRKLIEANKNGQVSVFLKPDGTPYKGWMRGTLSGIIKSAEVEPFTMHDLRHTFASHLVMDGVDLPTVQKLMGHASIGTTMIYAHLAPDHLKSAISGLARRFAENPTPDGEQELKVPHLKSKNVKTTTTP